MVEICPLCQGQQRNWWPEQFSSKNFSSFIFNSTKHQTSPYIYMCIFSMWIILHLWQLVVSVSFELQSVRAEWTSTSKLISCNSTNTMQQGWFSDKHDSTEMGFQRTRWNRGTILTNRIQQGWFLDKQDTTWVLLRKMQYRREQRCEVKLVL